MNRCNCNYDYREKKKKNLDVVTEIIVAKFCKTLVVPKEDRKEEIHKWYAKCFFFFFDLAILFPKR